MRGRVQVTSVGGVVELNGEMEYRFENVPTGIVLDVVVRRPLSGTPTARGGAYRFSLRHPMLGGAALTSRIDLPLVLQPSGRGLCGATADVVDDETVRAELAQSECLVSAGGRIHYAVPYRVPDAAAAPLLQMTGSIVGSGGAPGRGAF